MHSVCQLTGIVTPTYVTVFVEQFYGQSD